MGANEERVNRNGGALSYGNPEGAAGAGLMADLLAEMRHSDSQLGLLVVSGQGGIGVASVVERLH